VDRLFSDTSLAELYDAFCPREQRDDFRFYFPLVMSAHAVLDVGSGTGALLHWAREAGGYAGSTLRSECSSRRGSGRTSNGFWATCVQ
jgi:hypothetical protein